MKEATCLSKPALVEYKWGGENKQISREEKLQYVVDNSSVSIEDTVCFTLPGANPVFEKMLIDEKVALPNNIVGVQHGDVWPTSRGKIRDDGHHTLSLLKPLAKEIGIRVYRRDLRDILNHFADYKNHQDLFPTFGHRAVLAQGVDVVDLDTTCSVGKPLEDILELLFQSKMLHTKSLVMLNLVRDRHGGKSTTTRIARMLNKAGYTKAAESAYDYSTGLYNDKNRAALALEAVPTFYSLIASAHNYKLTLDKIVQYRDRISWMVQYLFSCEKMETQQEAEEGVAATEKICSEKIMEEWYVAKCREILGEPHYTEGLHYRRYNKTS